MRLVFAFVFKYGNIINQAFDFGSEYKYKAQFIDNKLTIDRTKNDKYVNDLYKDENGVGFDNITAIVGANASGKTSLIQCIILALNRSKTKANMILLIADDQSKPSFYGTDELYFRSISFETTFQLYDSYFSNNIYWKDIIFYSPIYDLKENWQHDFKLVDISSNRLIREDTAYSTIIGSMPNTIKLHNYEDIVRQLKFISYLEKNSIKFDNLKLPPNIILSVETLSIVNLDKTDWTEKEQRLYKIIWDKLDEDLKYENSTKTALFFEKWPSIFQNRTKQKIYYSFLRSFWFYLMSFIRINSFKRFDEYIELIEPLLLGLNAEDAIFKFIHDQSRFDSSKAYALLDSFKSLLEDNFLEKDLYNTDLEEIIVPIATAIQFESTYREYLLNIKEDDKLQSFSATPDIDTSLPFNFLNLEWGYSISSGEKVYINLFARFYHAVHNMLPSKKPSPSDEGTYIPPYLYILIDEGEAGFHLQWQKEYINNIITILPTFFLFKNEIGEEWRPNIQLILTTHSPICVSDIPEYNLIYLKKDQFGMCNVVENNKPKHSFGANIHDIIRDAFFLEGGFIGDFAYQKINDVILRLNKNENLTENEKIKIKEIIDLVDEPIIKVKLRELYARRINQNVEAERLKEQIAIMQKRLNDITDK